jgi:uncharacterized protein (DUF2141 family)
MFRHTLLTCVAAALLTTAALPGLAQAQTSDLTVTFEGVKTPSGSMMVALYDSAASFDGGGKPMKAVSAPVTGATVSAGFAALPPGQYGIKVFHDVDGDGRMGTNPFGIPTEPFAFSNNAQGVMGPAKWSAAAFTVSPGASAHSIVID